MSKIALLADVHLGAGSHQKSIITALTGISRYCEDNSISDVVVLGDLFHDRQFISIEVLCAAFEFFQSCKRRGIRWIAYPGNHDMFLKYSWKVNSLKPFSDVLTIINDVKLLDFDGRRFWVLPFIYSEAAYMRVLANIEKQYKPGDTLLTHIGVRSSTLNVCFMLQDWSVVDFSDSKFETIYTGHFHLYQKVGRNVWFPGSIVPFKFDEGDSEHGFFVYDLSSGKHNFVNIWDTIAKYCPDMHRPPQYCTFHDTLLADKSREEVAGNLIRVAVTREYSPNEKATIRDRLMNLGARSVSYLDLMKYDDKIESEEEVEALDFAALFQKFMDSDSKGIEGLRRNLLTKLDHEIRQEGDEIYSRISTDE